MSTPFKIAGPGLYRTRHGRVARVRRNTTEPQPAPFEWEGEIVGAQPDEVECGRKTWMNSGAYLPSGAKMNFDLVELIELDAPPSPTPEPFKIPGPGEYTTRDGRKAIVEFRTEMPWDAGPYRRWLVRLDKYVDAILLRVSTLGDQVVALKEDNAKLAQEIEVLRLYGNKDCTAIADERLKQLREERCV